VAPDPKVHKRYLDYREVYGYFARGKPMLDYAGFAAADAELGALAAREGLDDEEEARRAELEALLFRD